MPGVKELIEQFKKCDNRNSKQGNSKKGNSKQGNSKKGNSKKGNSNVNSKNQNHSIKLDNKIFGKLYHEMYKGNDKIIKNGIDQPLIKNIDTFHKLSNFSTIDDSFVNKSIKEYIKIHTGYEIIYDHVLTNGEKITLYFIIPEIPDFEGSSEVIHKYASIVFTWFEFIYPYSQKKCAKKLDVFIYLTPFKKGLPTNGSVIGKDHVNTAYTTSCVPKGTIVIYRNEEWLKVLIHETFHVLGLDFSQFSNTDITKEIKKLFPINSDINLYEAYTETWAEILNCVVVSFYKTTTEKDYLSKLHYCLNVESDFSIFQMLKVLNYMNLEYKDLYSNSEKSELKRLHFYKEDSNIFSYYIITALLLFNADKFVSWCDVNNSNMLKFSHKPTTNQSFIQLIEDNYNSSDFLHKIDCLNGIKLQTHNGKGELYDTMRMSIIDLL